MFGSSRSGRREHGLHELVVIDLDPSVAVAVESLERLGKGLDDDARAHEAVMGGGLECKLV